MPITVQTSTHVDNAINFINRYPQAGLYLGIGNPSSGSWTTPYSDTNPPTPQSNIVILDNPIGYKNIDQISLIYPSSTGTIQYQGQMWSLSTIADAYINSAYYVYITGSINNSELPTGVYYREVGLFANLALDSGVTGPAVLPNQVSNVGELLLVEYTGPTLRQADQSEQFKYVIQF